jgi:hypothetical protein
MPIPRSRASAPRLSVVIMLCVAFGPELALAQRPVAFQMGIPIAPQGLAHRPLPEGPFEDATAEGQDIRVVVAATRARS